MFGAVRQNHALTPIAVHALRDQEFMSWVDTKTNSARADARERSAMKPERHRWSVSLAPFS
jgi:hypothetical protein